MCNPLAIQCEDGTVLNTHHVVCLEVVKQGPKWQVRARTVLDPEWHNRTMFLVRDGIASEAEARTFAQMAFVR